jgi:hypothetical protein
MGGSVSLLSKKQPVSDTSTIGGQAKNMAAQAVPTAKNVGTLAAQQAVPLARNAGATVKQTADSAVAWATPYVGAARHWAAPYLEQSATAVTEDLAPKISDALRSAAQKIDYVEPKRHRISKNVLLAGSALLTAAGAAIAAISVMHRNGNGAGYTADGTMTTSPDAATSPGNINDGYGPDDRGKPDAEGNGHQTIV